MKNSFTYTLTTPQQASLATLLKTGNYRLAEVPYSIVAADGENCRIVLYTSGKCVIQGKGATDWVHFHLEPEVLGSAGLGYEDEVNPEGVQPHFGIDESGKGDFFGPMVIAAAYVDESLAPAFRELQVRDSKTVSTDKMAEKLSDAIIKLLGPRHTVIAISPRTYNKLYRTMSNVNRMLAWGHARAIENMLEIVPDCPRALSDQFGPKQQIERALMEKGRNIQLQQRPKAESDLAVAAASIIARAAFVRALRVIGQKYGVTIPKGASAQVKQMAIDLVKKHGPTVLLDTCKCHFRTTDEVLSAAGHQRKELGVDGMAISKSMRTEKPAASES